MNRFLTILLTVFASISGSEKLSAASCWSTATGNWTNPAIWSCGHVPTCGDNVSITTGTTVTVDAQLDYTGCTTSMDIAIWGTLQFGNGQKLHLKCGSNVYVETGGQILDAGGGGNSNQLQICGVTVWNAAAGPVTTGTCFPTPCNSPLPISLIDFSATAGDHAVSLNWVTLSEINNDYFTIEKSTDATNFVIVGKVDGAGNSSSTLKYQFTDETPCSGISYYRLKQTDFNGQFSYSNTVAVEFNAISDWGFALFPDPSDGSSFTLSFNSDVKDSEVILLMSDLNGKVIGTRTVDLSSANDVKWDLDPVLAAGTYLVTAYTSQQSFTGKLIVR